MKLVIIGASGHARVIADILENQYGKQAILGYLDDAIEEGTQIGSYTVLGKVAECENIKNAEFIIGIGSNQIREQIANRYHLAYTTAIDPTAFISKHAVIKEGSVVMPHATINTGAEIGRHCIINSSAVIEHDNVIQDFVHISPGAVLAGTVFVGTKSWVGAGASIKNNIAIGCNSIVGVGSVVIHDIGDNTTVAGVPAKAIGQ